jgi:GDP/UDP-N,N'-diacetylbacillosamine 2-epimerase (hydrolysing)
MRSVLEEIKSHPKLRLQIIATGMHLDRRHGESVRHIPKVDAVVKWPAGPRAIAVGMATASLAKRISNLKSEIVLVVGDRVEALAAATGAHLSDIPVAHVHGGDRALGQMDDSLRHAISKLAHIHFPATAKSAQRLEKMGEDPWRIHRVGSPGIDGIRETAVKVRGLKAGRYALLVLHPVDAGEEMESRRAAGIVRALRNSGMERVVVIYPNNDPGADGIIRQWESLKGDPRFVIYRDVPRAVFLGLLRDAAFLVGNSSAGIIEAASFRTPVIDIGQRQLGRERCKDVRNVPYDESRILAAIRSVWNGGRPRRGNCDSIYGAGDAGKRIAQTLAGVRIDQRLLRKIISY